MGLISRVSSRTYRNILALWSKTGKKKDDDQLFKNLTTQKLANELHNQPIQLEQVGLGQYYCIVTDRYFESEQALRNHMRGKSYKQKVKSLKKDKPYSHEEAAMAAGAGSYIKPVVTAQEAKLV